MTNLDARISALLARSEIETALNDYVLGIDGRNQDRWLGAFHSDALYEVDYPRALVTGHDEILAWVREPWEFQTLTHITANHQIDVIDETHARGQGRGVGIFKIKDGSVLLATARLDDQYLKREGVWKISQRKVSIISSFLLPGAQALILNGVAQI